MSLKNFAGKVLIYGGHGALGSVCVSHFKRENWWVGCVDMNINEEADANIVVKPNQSWVEQAESVLEAAKDILSNSRLDAVICVAGGWAGGNAASKDFIKNSDIMWKQSVWSSTIAANIAAKYLKQGGLIALPGAKPAEAGTPGMVGYGMAKAAVHQLVKSIGCEEGGLPADAVAVALLPITLDTPMNRKWMPKGDTSKWTPLEFISELLFKWSNGRERPASGSLVRLVTKDNETQLVID